MIYHQKKEQKSTNETGRSMVEMLGVLAVMGILAALGAKGYDMAMERAAANRIVEEVNRRSVIYSQQLLVGTSSTSLNHSELESEIEGGFVLSANRLGNDYFQITVQKTPGNICERIGKMGYARSIQLSSNGTSLTTEDQSGCQEINNTITFTFSRDLRSCEGCLSDSKTCESNAQCDTNQVCQNGLCACSPYYECNGTCCPSGQFCVNGSCAETEVCQSTDDCSQGVCMSGKCSCYSYEDNCDYFCLREGKAQSSVGVCSSELFAEEGTGIREGLIWSTKNVTWDTANDFCASYGKQMVTLEDLGCVFNSETAAKCAVPDKFKFDMRIWLKDKVPGKEYHFRLDPGGYANSNGDGYGGTVKVRAVCH